MIRSLSRTRWPLIAAMVVALGTLAGCQDREGVAPPAPTVNATRATPPATSSNDPAVVPGKGSEVTEKGTQTGMIGGESGTVASSGKPGSGTTSGAGTGPARSSSSQVEDKK